MIALEQLQGNILEGYPRAHCARLLACEVTDPAAARATLRGLTPRVTRHADSTGAHEQPLRLNIGFTYAGLRALALDGSELTGLARQLPFRASMQRRKHLLGDCAEPSDSDARWGERPLHVMLLLHLDGGRTEALYPLLEDEGRRARDPRTPWAACDGAPLAKALQAQFAAVAAELGPLTGLTARAIDLHHPIADGHGIEYFGFRDGVSNPAPLREGSLREFVLEEPDDALLDGGSFLVIRQLEQDLEAFWRELHARAEERGVPATELAEWLMGRRRTGHPLDGDGSGPVAAPAFDPADARSRCPFASHVRRMNPQVDVAQGGNPRLIRRGLSYLDAGGKRGLMFLAFNADIAAQFEFIQKNWVQRGNAAGCGSTDFDVIAGSASSPRARARFPLAPGEHEPLAFSSFVRPIEGEYLFIPSLPALAAIASEPSPRGTRPVGERDPIAQLLASPDRALSAAQRSQLQSWLDDAAWSRRFWQAVRERAKIQKTKGVAVGEYLFVAEPNEVRRILENREDAYSMREYEKRMAPSTGEFFLGMDEHGSRYRRERAAAKFLDEIAHDEVVKTAQEATRRLFLSALERQRLSGRSAPEVQVRELLATVLDAVAATHFGVPGASVRSLASWGKDLGWYLFRLCPNEIDAARAIEASQQYRGHVQRLCEEARAGALPQAEPLTRARSAIRTALERGKRGSTVSEDDVVRNLIGIITGSLGATMKLFMEGLALHLRVRGDGRIDWPRSRRASLYEHVIQRALAAGQRGGPDSLYRVQRKGGKIVVVWLGGAQEGYPDMLFGHGPHYCPGAHIGKAMIEGMLRGLRHYEGVFRGDRDEPRYEFKPRPAARRAGDSPAPDA